MWEAISVSGWEHSLSGEYLVNSLLFQSTTKISPNFLSFFCIFYLVFFCLGYTWSHFRIYHQNIQDYNFDTYKENNKDVCRGRCPGIVFIYLRIRPFSYGRLLFRPVIKIFSPWVFTLTIIIVIITVIISIIV